MWSSSQPSSEPGSNPPSSRPSRASKPRPKRRLFTVDDLHDEFRIGPGTASPGGVIQHAQPVAGCLADADIAGNQCFEDRLIEILSDLAGNFVSQLQARIVHREDNAPNLQTMVFSCLGLPGKLYDLGKPFHREVLALDRNVNLARRSQRRSRELADRRGTIQKHIVEMAELAGKLLAQGRRALTIRGRKRVRIGQA